MSQESDSQKADLWTATCNLREQQKLLDKIQTDTRRGSGDLRDLLELLRLARVLDEWTKSGGPAVERWRRGWKVEAEEGLVRTPNWRSVYLIVSSSETLDTVSIYDALPAFDSEAAAQEHLDWLLSDTDPRSDAQERYWGIKQILVT